MKRQPLVKGSTEKSIPAAWRTRWARTGVRGARVRGVVVAAMLWIALASPLFSQNPPGTPQQPAGGQAGAMQAPGPQQPGALQAGQGAPAGAPAGIPALAERLRPNYVLQVGDQIMIRARDVEELNDRPFRVEADGAINLPLIGRIKAAELTVEALEANLAQALRQFVVNPQVFVTLTQFKTAPIFVVGAFRAPGIYPLQGKRTLVEVLTSIGGLAPSAGRRIRLTRRMDAGKIPLPNATVSADGLYSSIEINIVSLQTSINPAEDVELEAYDIISAERAEMVFTVGAVGRVGGIEIGERESLSMMQALALAGGLAPGAKATKAYVLRPVMNSARRAEIPVNLKKLLKGEGNDVPLLPNDILFVPAASGSRVLLERASLLGFNVASGLLLFSLIGVR
jgi:polysaccharide biosynthesis/export protein